MKIRYFIDLDIPDEEVKTFSEGMDFTLYGNRVVEKLLQEANSCDDLPLDWTGEW
jgi:hypothetical protein